MAGGLFKPATAEEAIKALRKGVTVRCEWQGGVTEYDSNEDYQLYMGEILHGKWSIRGGDDDETE